MKDNLMNSQPQAPFVAIDLLATAKNIEQLQIHFCNSVVFGANSAVHLAHISSANANSFCQHCFFQNYAVNVMKWVRIECLSEHP